MDTSYPRFTGLNLVAIALVLPASCMVALSVMKYGLGFDGLFDTAQPFLDSIGFHEANGWTITFFIIIAPIIAVLITALQVLSVEWQFNDRQLSFYISIHKRWLPISIAVLGSIVLLLQAIYLQHENAAQHIITINH